MQIPSDPADIRMSLHEWACLRTELIWIYDGPVPPKTRRLNNSDHRTESCIWYLRKGNVRVVTKLATYHAGPGMWLMLPRENCEHEFSKDAHILSMNFICRWPSGEGIFAYENGLVLKGTAYPHLEKNAKKLERMVRRYFPSVDPQHYATGQLANYSRFLEFQALFFNWLSSWFRVRIEQGASLTRIHGGDQRSLQAARCLNEAPFNRGAPKKWLYKEVGMSEGHLNRLFLADFGITPYKYWEHRRLEYAKMCLETESISVKEIAYRVGFRSASHFVAWFQRLANSSPGHYRDSSRQA